MSTRTPRMVITQLMGGLGNQMFQYAAGYSLAKLLGVPLLLDRIFLDSRPAEMSWTRRSLELDAFRLSIEFAPDEMVERMRRDRWFASFRRSECFKESAKNFDERFFRLQAPVLIDGYWQCERYFASHADALRNELFVPKDPPSPENLRIRDAISQSTSVSLHIRRGDYVTNTEAGRFHGMPSLSYYTKAVEELRTQHGVDRCFIFSDDPEWTAANLRLPCEITHVTHNSGTNSHWDLWLMKHCQHHIIANSSFSWWGAWLNPRAEKTVIAPKKWFADNAPANDIIPATWLVR